METKSDPRYEKLKALVDKYNEYLDFWGDLCLGFECEVRRFNGGEWIISEIDSPSVIYSVEDFKRIVNVDFPNAIRKHLDKITRTWLFCSSFNNLSRLHVFRNSLTS